MLISVDQLVAAYALEGFELRENDDGTRQLTFGRGTDELFHQTAENGMLDATFVLDDIRQSAEIGVIEARDLDKRMRERLSHILLGSSETK